MPANPSVRSSPRFNRSLGRALQLQPFIADPFDLSLSSSPRTAFAVRRWRSRVRLATVLRRRDRGGPALAEATCLRQGSLFGASNTY